MPPEITQLRAPLWDRCLLKLEAELSDQQLNTWIRPLQAWHDDDQLRILAPNRFVLDMVQSSFHARIQEIATALTAPDPIIVKLVIGSGQINETRDAFKEHDSQPASRSGERNTTFNSAPAHSQIAKSSPPLDSHLKPELPARAISWDVRRRFRLVAARARPTTRISFMGPRG